MMRGLELTLDEGHFVKGSNRNLTPSIWAEIRYRLSLCSELTGMQEDEGRMEEMGVRCT